MKKEHYNYTYVHFFLHESVFFNLKLIDMFCDPQNDFDIAEHLFVTSYKPLFDTIKDRYKCDIKLDMGGRYTTALINKYGSEGKWLFVHSFPGKADDFILTVRRKFLKRILWRTWGHDVERNIKNDNKFVWIYLTVSNIWRVYGRRRIKQIYAVGIANIVDELNVRERYGIKRVYRMPYPTKGEYEILANLKENPPEDEMKHIMIGHSGAQSDRHCKVIDMLRRFEKEKLTLHLVLAYGDPQYIKEVKEYVHKNWKGKVEYHEKMAGYEEYAKYVNNMDAIILDCLPSSGLGNLMMFLSLGKKIFLNRNGILQKGLQVENIKFHFTDELLKMTYDELVQKEEYSLPEETTLSVLPYLECVNKWKEIYETLAEK